jgi:anaerobic magnesium-protoporphyrin IX monomethyl ester cyclase
VARILIINPVVREEDVPRHIPYGEALLAAIAIQHGHEVCVYDANAWRQPISKLSDACKADDWDAICIGGLTTTYNYIKQACEIIKMTSPKSTLIAGGGFLTSMPQEMMGFIPEIDIGVIGEAFNTFPEILKQIDEHDLDFSETKGIIYRRKGIPILNSKAILAKDLDSIPYPAWDLFPLEEVYFKNSSSLYSEDAYHAQRRIDINGSYGCSLVCKYCWHLGTTGDMEIIEKEGNNEVVFSYAREIRCHSAEYIVDMVKDLKKKYGIDQANFLDENLMTVQTSTKRLGGEGWMVDVCEEWIRQGLAPVEGKYGYDQPGVRWSGTSHASLAKVEVLEIMKESGCTHLVYGLESFDPKILKNLGKGSNRKNNIRSVGECMSTGIIPVPNIIIGFPEETFESIRNTISALIELGIHAKPHFATAYPGSEWYYSYKSSIIKQYDGDLEAYIKDLGDATKITGTISHNFTGVELLGLQEIVSTRNLRLLDQFEANYTPRSTLVEKHTSINFHAGKSPIAPAHGPLT